MAVADAVLVAKIDFAIMVHDVGWAFIVECNFDSFAHDACITVADMDVRYFDSGASKHITSHRDLFSSLETIPVGNSVLCANSSYPVQGLEKFSWLLQMEVLLFCWMYYLCQVSRRTCCQSLHLLGMA